MKGKDSGERRKGKKKQESERRERKSFIPLGILYPLSFSLPRSLLLLFLPLLESEFQTEGGDLGAQRSQENGENEEWKRWAGCKLKIGSWNEFGSLAGYGKRTEIEEGKERRFFPFSRKLLQYRLRRL